jgi:hypothetical protein
MISSRRPGIGKRVFVLTLAATLLAVGVPTEGQQRAQPTRMGFLTTVPLATIADRLEAFRQGLHDLGYTEGENIVIEWRSTEGKEDRLPALAAELSRLKMQVIVSAGSSVTRVLKEATSSIPIVMALDADPVGNQFVASLARPGGNVTGLSLLSPEIAGKRLELLKEIVPKLSRVAVLGSSTRPGNAQELRETEHAAANLGLRIQYLDVRGSGDIETAFQAARKGARAGRSSKGACGPRGKDPPPGSVQQAGIHGCGRIHDVRSEHYRFVPPLRDLCGQNLERRQARRSSRRAADEVRIGNQFKDRKANRPDDPAERAGTGGSGDQITVLNVEC